MSGLSIAFSIAEELQASAASTMFVTHYPQITSLASMYPNVKNVHLRTSLDAERSGGSAVASTGPLKYLHEVGAGPCDMKSGYGLLMAEQSGFPRAVLQDARHLRSAVRDRFPVLVQGGSGDGGGGSGGVVGAMTTLLQHLLLVQNVDIEDSALRQYLHGLRERVPDHAAQQMLQWLNDGSVGSGEDAGAPGDSRHRPQNLPSPDVASSNTDRTLAESVIVTPRRERDHVNNDAIGSVAGTEVSDENCAKVPRTDDADIGTQLNIDDFS